MLSFVAFFSARPFSLNFLFECLKYEGYEKALQEFLLYNLRNGKKINIVEGSALRSGADSSIE